MKFTAITYRRVKNLGNYESEALEMSVEVDDEQNIENAVYLLRNMVWEQLNRYPIPREERPTDLSDF